MAERPLCHLSGYTKQFLSLYNAIPDVVAVVVAVMVAAAVVVVIVAAAVVVVTTPS